jgi:hypothetical protein
VVDAGNYTSYHTGVKRDRALPRISRAWIVIWRNFAYSYFVLSYLSLGNSGRKGRRRYECVRARPGAFPREGGH